MIGIDVKSGPRVRIQLPLARTHLTYSYIRHPPCVMMRVITCVMMRVSERLNKYTTDYSPIDMLRIY